MSVDKAKNFSNALNERLEIKPTEKLEDSQDHSLVFNIPVKAKTKIATKAFNVVMPLTLVDKLDKICKKKGGYSRNELINMMCQLVVDNLGE